jgi:hypothetical protein
VEEGWQSASSGRAPAQKVSRVQNPVLPKKNSARPWNTAKRSWLKLM